MRKTIIHLLNKLCNNKNQNTISRYMTIEKYLNNTQILHKQITKTIIFPEYI